MTTTAAIDQAHELRRQVAIAAAAQLVAGFAQVNTDVKLEHVFPLAESIVAWLAGHEHGLPLERKA